MIYTIGEKSLNFILNDRVYFCSSDDERFDIIKEILMSGKEEKEVEEFYYRKFVQDAKDMLNGDKKWGQLS